MFLMKVFGLPRFITILLFGFLTGIWGLYPANLGATEPISTSETKEVEGKSPMSGKGFLLGKKKEFANVLRSLKWQFGQISVCWENRHEANEDTLKLIRKSVNDTWEKHSNIKFLGWGPCPEGKASYVRVFFADSNPKVNGIGNELADLPKGVVLNVMFEKDLYLKSRCTANEEVRTKCIRGMVIHEFGHVLGFTHEQNRDDTPKWCKDFESGRNGDWTSEVWDRASVMNYCSSEQHGAQGWPLRQQLSGTDILAAQLIYGIPVSR